MVAYYQHNIAHWMDGTESLPDGEYRAYHVICELLYLNNGPIIAHESGIAGRCNQHPLAFRSNLKKLVERGKITFTADGKITNKRVEIELAKIASRRRRPPTDPQSTSRQPPQGRTEVRAGSEGGNADKYLKNKDPTLFTDALDKKKRREDFGEANASPPDNPRTRLFRNGLNVLAMITGRTPDSCRSLIGKWLRAVDDEAVHVLAAIEDAERNRVIDPTSWITQRLKPHNGGTNGIHRDDDRSASRAAGRLAAKAERGEFTFGPRPSLLPETGGNDARLLPAGRSKQS